MSPARQTVGILVHLWEKEISRIRDLQTGAKRGIKPVIIPHYFWVVISKATASSGNNGSSNDGREINVSSHCLHVQSPLPRVCWPRLLPATPPAQSQGLRLLTPESPACISPLPDLMHAL